MRCKVRRPTGLDRPPERPAGNVLSNIARVTMLSRMALRSSASSPQASSKAMSSSDSPYQ
jgi:hypothetical protein